MTPQDLKQIGSLFDKRFDKIDKKFDYIDKRFDEIDKDITEIKSDVSVIKTNFSKLNHNVSIMQEDIVQLIAKTIYIDENIQNIDDKLSAEIKEQDSFRQIIDYNTNQNTHRIDELEHKVFGSVIGA